MDLEMAFLNHNLWVFPYFALRHRTLRRSGLNEYPQNTLIKQNTKILCIFLNTASIFLCYHWYITRAGHAQVRHFRSKETNQGVNCNNLQILFRLNSNKILKFGSTRNTWCRSLLCQLYNWNSVCHKRTYYVTWKYVVSIQGLWRTKPCLSVIISFQMTLI